MKKVLRLSIFVMGAIVATIAQASVIAHWDFDSSYTDAEGNAGGTFFDGGANGLGGITATTSAFGAGSLDITGDGDRVYPTYGGNNWVLFNDDTAWSMSFWQKTATANYSIGHSGGSSGVALWGNGTVYFRDRNGAAVTGIGTWANDANWNHITITADGSDTDNLTLYVNGSFVQTSSIAKTDFLLNSIGTAFTTDFVGQLDEVWLTDSALSSTEVSSLYNSNVIPEPATLGLIGFVSVSLLWIRRTFLV